VLQAAFTTYLVGCILWYFFWYKNGQIIHIAIIALVVGSIGVFISEYKTRNVILKSESNNKTIFIVLFIVMFMGVFGSVNDFAKKRVDNILNNGPTKQAIATVVDVDIRSTRSGKQAWSIINYDVTGTTFEQSFADTSNPRIGDKYLIKYSLQYPDMFRKLRKQ
jgi:hypothetical protein